jgi:hypothetical protein
MIKALGGFLKKLKIYIFIVLLFLIYLPVFFPLPIFFPFPILFLLPRNLFGGFVIVWRAEPTP